MASTATTVPTPLTCANNMIMETVINYLTKKQSRDPGYYKIMPNYNHNQHTYLLHLSKLLCWQSNHRNI